MSLARYPKAYPFRESTLSNFNPIARRKAAELAAAADLGGKPQLCRYQHAQWHRHHARLQSRVSIKTGPTPTRHQLTNIASTIACISTLRGTGTLTDV